MFGSLMGNVYLCVKVEGKIPYKAYNPLIGGIDHEGLQQRN